MKIKFIPKSAAIPSTWFKDLKVGDNFTMYPDQTCSIYTKIATCGDRGQGLSNAFCHNSSDFVAFSGDRVVFKRNCELLVEEL